MNNKVAGFFYLFLLFIFLVPILGLATLSIPPFESIEMKLFLLFCLLIVLMIILRQYFKERRIAQIEKEERLESLNEGGIEEPRIIRELTDKEKEDLGRFHKTSKLIVDNIWWILTVMLAIDSLGVYWIFNSEPKFTEDVIQPVYAFLLAVQLAIAGIAANETPLYRDLRSPVFRVQGKAIKEKIQRKGGYDYFVTVRRIKFSADNSPEIKDVFETFENEDEVAVEYSSHTKRVWKMYKT